MKRLGVIIIAALIACSQPPAAVAPAEPEEATAAPVAEQASAASLTPEFLVGRWGDNGDCSAPIWFKADGTFESGGAQGRWTLAGDIITMQGAAGVFQLRAEALNQNQILIGNPNGSIGLSQRCEH